MTARTKSIVCAASLILSLFLCTFLPMIPSLPAGSPPDGPIFALPLLPATLSTIDPRPASGTSAREAFFSGPPGIYGTHGNLPIAVFPLPSEAEAGFCHHPGISPVPLWVCSHDGPAGPVPVSTLFATEVSLQSDIPIPAPSLALYPQDLPASANPDRSPVIPPESPAEIV